jgi:hypothetical protein
MKLVVFSLNKAGIDLNFSAIEVQPSGPIETRVSSIQLDVLAVFRVMYGHEKVFSEHILDSSLDIKCDVWVPHLNLAIEIDGLTHFVGSSSLLTAKSAFRTGVQRDLGFKTLTLNHKDWSPLKGLNQKLKFLSDQINGALATN